MDLLLIPIVVYALFAIPALVWLSRRRIDQLTQAVWALVVVSIPIMGAIALVLVRPGELRTPDPKTGFELDEFRRQ